VPACELAGGPPVLSTERTTGSRQVVLIVDTFGPNLRIRPKGPAIRQVRFVPSQVAAAQAACDAQETLPGRILLEQP
jgi:hypothetical protein